MDLEIVDMKNLNDRKVRTAISQPGLRYAQVEALVQSLLMDETFSGLSLAERNYVLERIRSEVRGRMMEDIVLLETKKAFPEKQVFKCQFAIGEFDMVIFDPENGTCEIFEIKHSAECVPEQCRYLKDEQKCAETEFRFGPITGKTVIYRGEDKEAEEIHYRNVENYLLQIMC